VSPLIVPGATGAQDDGERRFDLASFLLWLGGLALVTVALLTVRSRLDKAHIALSYLLVVLGAGASTGRRIGIALSVVAFV
jgi:K+-sensing histidine kinase KdpD